MKHQKKGRKFGRERNQRVALMNNLAKSLISDGRIRTTEAKAKELRPFVEKLITASIKKAKPAIKTDRASGYTRIIKMPRRKSDGSKMALIEFIN